MTSVHQYPPNEIVIAEFNAVLSRSESSVSLLTIESSLGYVEVAQTHFYEVLESRWESEGYLYEDNNVPPGCVSAAPCSKERSSEEDPKRSIPKRPCRRGSLVMTLKKTVMPQEDNSGLGFSSSPNQPAIPVRRASIVMSLGSTDNSKGENQLGSFGPVPSIVMNIAPVPNAASQPKKPLRRGSIVTFSELEYGTQEITGPQKSGSREPPKYPYRKSSMDLNPAANSVGTSPLRRIPESSRVSSNRPHTHGQCYQQPKYPRRKASMDMCSSRNIVDQPASSTCLCGHDVVQLRVMNDENFSSLFGSQAEKQSLQPSTKRSLVLSFSCIDQADHDNTIMAPCNAAA